MSKRLSNDGLLNSVVIENPKVIRTASETVEIDKQPVVLGWRRSPRPVFSEKLPMYRHSVLVRIDAFSCNYRDKALIHQFLEHAKTSLSKKTNGFGSEFSGRVIAVGDSVSSLKIGDEVMPDAAYPGQPHVGVTSGIVTNYASIRWGIFDERKLCKIPSWLSTAEAAGFTLAAQTAQSMIRKAELKNGDSVIVTSARSSTSLSLLSILSYLGIKTIAVSSSRWSDEQRGKLSNFKIVPELALVDDLFLMRNTLRVDAVFDPFADINFSRAAPMLRQGGKYVICGFKNQHVSNITENEHILDIYRVYENLIAGNRSLIGNCIGTSRDLYSAIRMGQEIKIPLDSIYASNQVGQFVNRTFNDRNKFGKVVFDYTL